MNNLSSNENFYTNLVLFTLHIERLYSVLLLYTSYHKYSYNKSNLHRNIKAIPELKINKFTYN